MAAPTCTTCPEAHDMDTAYVSDCLVCGEPTGFRHPNETGSCDPCTPHICTPELPEDDWCDICGKDI